MADQAEPTTSQAQPAPPQPNGNGKTRPGRKVISRVLIAAAIIAGLVFGVPRYLHSRTHESTDDAFVEGHVIPISPRIAGHVAKVNIRDNQWVKAGEVLVEIDTADYQAQFNAAQANYEAALSAHQSSDISVQLTSIATSATLDEARSAIKIAEAMIENAKAMQSGAASQREQASTQVTSAKAALAEARSGVDSAKASHERDAQDLQRFREMAKEDTATQQQLDHAIATEQMSASGLDAAHKKVETQQAMVGQSEAAVKVAEDAIAQAESQVRARESELQQAQARLSSARSAPQKVQQSQTQTNVAQANIDQAKADLEQARLNLSYAKIVAPADGYVARKGVEPGMYVQVGQSLLAIVQRDVWVVANFKETQLTKMLPGQPVEVEVDTYPGVDFHGHIESIQRGTGSRFGLFPAENATGNFVKVIQRVPVKIVFEPSRELDNHPLSPGMSVLPDVDIAAAGKTMSDGENRAVSSTR